MCVVCESMRVCGKKESNAGKVTVIQHKGVRELTGIYSAHGDVVQVSLLS